MKKGFVFILLISSFCGFAQLSEIGNPTSVELELSPLFDVSVHEVAKPDMSDLVSEMRDRKKQHLPIPAGKTIPTNFDVLKFGTWDFLEEEGIKVCRAAFKAEGASFIGLNFSEISLPIGAKLFFYSTDVSSKLGPFTDSDLSNTSSFSSGVIKGDELILELILPTENRQKPTLEIESLIYLVDYSSDASRDFGDADNCHVNINCDEGNNWRDQQNAVVRILMYINGDYGWCSGTIMNNTFQDCAPYILTADHCRSVKAGSEVADADFAKWEFYFNYEGPKCRNPKESDVPVGKITGCKKVSNSGKMAEGDPDFMLLKLSSDIPQFYNPFFAGWDARNIASNSGVMIHHPAGDIKKISTYSGTLESSEWNTSVKDTHWKLYWSDTKEGRGVSQSGSSGSALWNSDKRVAGQLTGGSSGCVDDGSTGPNNPDYFGKMSAGWFMKADDPTLQLKAWLDEGNSLRNFIDGIKWPCSEDPLGIISIEELRNGIKLFPNPTTNQFQIDLNGHFNYAIMVKLRNQMGQELAQYTFQPDDNVNIDVSDYPSGLYLVELQSGETIIHKTLIKE